MKNKRVYIVIAAVAVSVAVISGLAWFFMAPLFSSNKQEQYVGEKSGADVLKTVCVDFKSKMRDVLSASVKSATGEKVNLDGSLDIEEAVINGRDYTEGKTLHVDMADLQKDAIMSQIKSSFNTGVNIDFDRISAIVGNMDEETIKQYEKIADKLSGYMITAAETVVDAGTYEKQPGTVNLSVGDETLEAVSYKVNIPVEVVIGSTEKAIDDIFNDAEIAPYITMLKVLGAQLEKEELKKSFREQFKVDNIYFTMYVKEEKLCGMHIDGTWYDKNSKDKAEWVFWNDKFSFDIDVDNYYGKSCKLKGNGAVMQEKPV